MITTSAMPYTRATNQANSLKHTIWYGAAYMTF